MKLSARRVAGWVFAILMLTACGSSPTRQQADFLRLSRQTDSSYRNGQYAFARKHYAKLIVANPRFVTGHVRLGVIAYSDGDSATARARFERALALDATNEQAQYNLAMLHLNDAMSLLEGYARAAPPAGSRERVLQLIAQLKEFGAER